MSRITGSRGRKPGSRQHRAARSAGRGARRGLSYGRWSGQRERGSWLWQRLQGPLRLAVALAVLGLLNVYVLYWRRGTSVPALWDLANAGRRASLGARLQGPVGTPPVPITKAKKLHTPPLPDYPRVVDIALQEGAAMHSVLLRAGQSGRTLSELDSALQSLLDPGGIGIGQTLTLYYDAEDRLSTVDYRLNPGLAYHLERVQTGGAERFVSQRQAEPLTIQEVALQATLERPMDFPAAIVRAGETPALAARLAELFACELNLYADARAGDRLRIVVEKHSLGSRFYRYGRLLAAEYIPAPGGPRTSRLRAFLSPSSAASNAGAGLGTAALYYTENGESLARSLCRAPLQWSRVASTAATSAGSAAGGHLAAGAASRPAPSGPSGPRPQATAAGSPGSMDLTLFRPQLHAERSRLGLDYPAPAGTPVLAAAAGKLVFHGARGPQGNTIVLTHAGAMETSYQHLGRFARGLVDGQPVRLRQIIGYVGQSGQASRPHLHLGVRINSKLVDPSRVKPPREAPLPESQRTAFAQRVAETSEMMAHIGEAAGGWVAQTLGEQPEP